MRLLLMTIITTSFLCIGNNSYAAEYDEDTYVYGSPDFVEPQRQLPVWVTNNIRRYEEHFISICEGGVASMSRYLVNIDDIFQSRTIPPKIKLKRTEEERRKFKSGSGIDIGEYLQGCLAPLVPFFTE